MKTVIKVLRDFIKDFDLEGDHELVCFNARIEFNNERASKNIDSEVHLITIQRTGLSVFYLLSLEIWENLIPDHFPYNSSGFCYARNEFLMITGSNSFYKFYNLKIFPKDKAVPGAIDNDIGQGKYQVRKGIADRAFAGSFAKVIR